MKTEITQLGARQTFGDVISALTDADMDANIHDGLDKPPPQGAARTEDASPSAVTTQSRLVLVTGRAGAGRTTAVNALEDLGFERIGTPPLSFIPAILRQLVDAGPQNVVIGVHARSLDFNLENYQAMVQALEHIQGLGVTMVYLDGQDDVLRRRYTETRRRHPLCPAGAVEQGLALDRAMMTPLRGLADIVIDTSDFAPTDLHRILHQHLAQSNQVGATLSVVSFAYKNGLPVDADLVFDCRFLRNPHYDPTLRPKDGRDQDVRDYIAQDDKFDKFFNIIKSQMALMSSAFDAKGQRYVTLAFGCTGGKHRSVALAEMIAAEVSEMGWRPIVRHREIERGPMALAVDAHDPVMRERK